MIYLLIALRPEYLYNHPLNRPMVVPTLQLSPHFSMKICLAALFLVISLDLFIHCVGLCLTVHSSFRFIAFTICYCSRITTIISIAAIQFKEMISWNNDRNWPFSGGWSMAMNWKWPQYIALSWPISQLMETVCWARNSWRWFKGTSWFGIKVTWKKFIEIGRQQLAKFTLATEPMNIRHRSIAKKRTSYSPRQR